MKFHHSPEKHVVFDCPGCGRPHVVPVTRVADAHGRPVSPSPNDSRWLLIGSGDDISVTPSVSLTLPPMAYCCHFNITNGHIVFYDNCSHRLKGITVEPPEWDHPNWVDG